MDNTIREICTRCGMVANLDPSLHTERYGHKPEINRDGKHMFFCFHRYAFTPYCTACVNEARRYRHNRVAAF